MTLNFVVCGNTETVGNNGELCDEAANAWTREACRALDALPFVGSVKVDSYFPSWHGGRYAHQTAMYGYQAFGSVICTGGEREVIDSDGDTDTEVVRWADLPVELRADYEAQVWTAIKKADAEAAAVQKADDEEQAKFAAEDAEDAK